MPPSRRAVLLSGATLLTAGCSRLRSSGPKTDTERPTTSGDECQRGVGVYGWEFDPASELLFDLSESERSIVAAAVADGHAEVQQVMPMMPLPAGVFVEYGDAFYQVDYTVANREQVPVFDMTLRTERGLTVPANATAVDFEDLPAVDRKAIRVAIGSNIEGPPEGNFETHHYPGPFPGDSDDSELIGSISWVRWDNRTLRVETADERTSMQTLTTLRYTVEQVAQDAEALGQFVADQYLVHLDDLSYYQRAILQSAHDKGYSECKPASVPFSELRERLSGATTLPRPMDDSWFVAFEGRQFRLSVLEWSV